MCNEHPMDGDAISRAFVILLDERLQRFNQVPFATGRHLRAHFACRRTSRWERPSRRLRRSAPRSLLASCAIVAGRGEPAVAEDRQDAGFPAPSLTKPFETTG